MLKKVIRIKPIKAKTVNHRLLMLKITCIRSDYRTFNNTNNIYKHMNQCSTGVFNNYKINKIHNVKKTYYEFTNDCY